MVMQTRGAVPLMDRPSLVPNELWQGSTTPCNNKCYTFICLLPQSTAKCVYIGKAHSIQCTIQRLVKSWYK